MLDCLLLITGCTVFVQVYIIIISIAPTIELGPSLNASDDWNQHGSMLKSSIFVCYLASAVGATQWLSPFVHGAATAPLCWMLAIQSSESAWP